MQTLDRLQKLTADEAKAAERARLAAEKLRRKEIARKAEERKILDARAFLIGRTILAAELSDDEARVLAGILDRGVKGEKQRELVFQFLLEPKAPPIMGFSAKVV